MSGGLKEFCRQMTTHNAPLKMTNDAPVIGRFYATQCQQQRGGSYKADEVAIASGATFVRLGVVSFGVAHAAREPPRAARQIKPRRKLCDRRLARAARRDV